MIHQSKNKEPTIHCLMLSIKLKRKVTQNASLMGLQVEREKIKGKK